MAHRFRYLIFGGDNYYPQGGADDFINGYDDVKEAVAAANEWVAA